MEIEDYFRFSHGLESVNSIFSKIWEVGKPNFTKDVPTAAIRFDINGKYVSFIFNPDFWESLNDYNKKFVICHEMLHIILNHGTRAKDTQDKDRANQAMDIVVNELLVSKFGFKRNKIKGQEDYCWADTCFANKVDSNLNFEKYFNMLKGNPSSKKTIDCHGNMPTTSDMKDVLSEVNKTLSDEEKKTIEGITGANFDKNGIGASEDGDFYWDFTLIDQRKVIKKKKWETIVKNIIKTKFTQGYRDIEQWARTNRRNYNIQSELILPSEMEQDALNFDKFGIFFYQDTSGSCVHLIDRFYKAIASLPKDKFDIRMFCFDTKVYPTTLESKKLYGFGGTKFSCIEKHIQKTIEKEKIRHPEIIFILTDGVSCDKVFPQYPKKWYFFLSQEFPTLYKYLEKSIPPEAHRFNLTDFE